MSIAQIFHRIFRSSKLNTNNNRSIYYFFKITNTISTNANYVGFDNTCKFNSAADRLVMKDFDALAEVAEPPPTFRAQDERRKATYVELMFSFGRSDSALCVCSVVAQFRLVLTYY